MLQFTPKENVTANVPTTDGAVPAKSLDVKPLVDARQLADLTLVGENRERRIPKPVRATTSVADFATDVLKKCLSEWGVRLGPGGLVLRGEITNLFVTEENMYSTAVNVRFRAETESGEVLWQGIASGDARQWGRSFEEENYNEQISDALKRTFANLVSAPGFQRAWAGLTPAPGNRVEASELKARVLEMMAAGIGTAVIESYARRVELAEALSADQILDWKKSGISESVIQAALDR